MTKSSFSLRNRRFYVRKRGPFEKNDYLCPLNTNNVETWKTKT